MLWQPLSVGLTAMMLAMPAYAEKENTAVPATPETVASTVVASEVAPAVENLCTGRPKKRSCSGSRG